MTTGKAVGVKEIMCDGYTYKRDWYFLIG